MSVTVQDVEEWVRLKEQLADIKDKEMTLRKKIFKAYFPAPTEGTNTFAMAQGWQLKGKYVITRNVDKALLQAATDNLRENGVNVDMLINWSPALAMKQYRELSKEQLLLVDQVLEIKEGSPGLELVPPKEKG